MHRGPVPKTSPKAPKCAAVTPSPYPIPRAAAAPGKWEHRGAWGGLSFARFIAADQMWEGRSKNAFASSAYTKAKSLARAHGLSDAQCVEFGRFVYQRASSVFRG
eukprot:5088399-Pyramimonas_sp.AAC.1